MGIPSNPRSGGPREIRSLSPEARRRRLLDGDNPHHAREAPESWRQWLTRIIGPGTRTFVVVRRTLVGAWNDGFIHAGNLAYLSLLAIFPFFIIGAAIFEVIGGSEQSAAMIETVLTAMPPTVSSVVAPVAEEAMDARAGWLLWLGAGIALWTVSSLVETIRDILRRAYGTEAIHAFWKYRLFSAGLIVGAMVLLMVSLFAQVVIGAAQQVILNAFPQLTEAISMLRLSRMVPALGLFASLYMLFFTLTPEEYRARRYPKWPGALITALWWLGVSTAMPPILSGFFTYDLTYGSLAGIIIAMLFFWLVGLGLVIGAELNAALAEPDACHRDDEAGIGGSDLCDGTRKEDAA